jgi:hypothetical protein
VTWASEGCEFDPRGGLIRAYSVLTFASPVAMSWYDDRGSQTRTSDLCTDILTGIGTSAGAAFKLLCTIDSHALPR